MKRTIYVIRDSISGKYYDSARGGPESYNYATGEIYGGDFEGAIIHTTLSSVRDGVKARMRRWKKKLQNSKTSTKLDVQFNNWIRWEFEEAQKRINLPACGMEIVAIELTDEGEIIPLKG